MRLKAAADGTRQGRCEPSSSEPSLGLTLEAKRQHQMRASLQFASKRLGAAMLQNAHCIERTQHPFDRSVLSPAAVSQLFDLARQISQVQLVKDVFERFQSAVFQMHFPEHIGLNDSHWHALLKGLNWPPMIQDKGLSMSIIYNKKQVHVLDCTGLSLTLEKNSSSKQTDSTLVSGCYCINCQISAICPTSQMKSILFFLIAEIMRLVAIRLR